MCRNNFPDHWRTPLSRLPSSLNPIPNILGNLCLLVEPLIAGQFTKYNNNCGFVDFVAKRATPHAFSHFTYHFTKGNLLVCDIQGVGDIYTDPQIHSRTGKGLVYGKVCPSPALPEAWSSMRGCARIQGFNTSGGKRNVLA